MKMRMVDFLACPESGMPLRLAVFSTIECDDTIAPDRVRCRRYCARNHCAIGGEGEQPTPSDCVACYQTEVRDGVLISPAGLVYPVVDGVPRLVRNSPKDYREFFTTHDAEIRAAVAGESRPATEATPDDSVYDTRSPLSFGLQWEKHQYGDRTWGKDDENLRRDEILYSLNCRAEELDGSLILDAGCGNGHLTAQFATYGAEVVGMDLSLSVEKAYANRRRLAGPHVAEVHFLQGNLMEPPFLKGSFDIAHSSGVIVATPDPDRAFHALVATVRAGGRTFIQVYRERGLIITIDRALRVVTTRMPVKLLWGLLYALAPVHEMIHRVFCLFRGEKPDKLSRRERAITMFDNYSPKYQHRFTPEQVEQMFRKEGLSDLKDVTLDNERRHCISMVGVRPEAVAREPQAEGVVGTRR